MSIIDHTRPRAPRHNPADICDAALAKLDECDAMADQLAKSTTTALRTLGKNYTDQLQQLRDFFETMRNFWDSPTPGGPARADFPRPQPQPAESNQE